MKGVMKNIGCIMLMLIMVLTCTVGISETYAATKRPGQVKGFKAPLDEQGVNTIIYFTDKNNPFAIPLDIEREAWLYWKNVKGASGYKVYMSTKGPDKGFKAVKTIVGNSTFEGVNDYPLRYTGFNKAEAWVKVKAYKKVGKKKIYGKASKVIKLTILQDPVFTSLENSGASVSAEWTPVHKADHYEVYIARVSDMRKWAKEYNKSREEENQISYMTPAAFFAVAEQIGDTQETSIGFNLPDTDSSWKIQVTAVYGKARSSEYGYVDIPDSDE